MVMAGNVKIPGIGEVPKSYAIGGAVIGAGAAYYLYKRQKGASSASSATTTPGTSATGYPSGLSGADPYPPDGTTGNPSDPYSTDPATGETYGDEDSGYTGVGGLGGLQDYPGGYYPPPATTGPQAPATPQEWASQVESVLGGLGFGQQAIADALGAYLAGQELTSAQAEIVRAGLGQVPFPGTAPPVKVKPDKPAKKGGTQNVTQRIASGRQSLDAAAKQYGVTTAKAIDDSESHLGTGALIRFREYVANGTNKAMPKGLVYFT